MALTSFTSERTRDVLETACRSVGLDPADAAMLRFGENAMYRLTDHAIVARVGRSIQAAEKEANVARWLAKNQFSAASLTPNIDQPVLTGELPVTFWKYIPDSEKPVTSAEFGKLLRDLHALPHPTEFRLPEFSPMPKTEERLADLAGQLPSSDLDFLRRRYEEVSEKFDELDFVLPRGPVHGDAHPGNVMRPTDGILKLIDFEDFAYGPREWDAAVLSVRHQAFGWVSDDEYRVYVGAYGFDPISWPGFRVIRAARELNMTTWLAQTVSESPEIEAEVRKRISDLRDEQAPRHWRVF